MRGISTLFAAALAVVAAAGPGAAADRLVASYTPVNDYVGLWAAKENGFFAKNGIDAELQVLTLSSTTPAAVMSNSVQIGGTTLTTFLQAVDGGLDLVIPAGVSVAREGAGTPTVFARKDAGIKTAEDFIGKKVGVGGLGSTLDVAFRRWLMDKGVDTTKVTFVEVSFPQMLDVLRGGTVDAVISADPVSPRIVASGVGVPIVRMTEIIPHGSPTIVFIAARGWTRANADLAKRFRKAITEADDYVKAHPAEGAAIIAKYLKYPPDVAKALTLPPLRADVDPPQVGWWIDTMQAQTMLRTKLDAARLVLP
jgi:NitT/TauT family transport system substrate-binding protein